MTAIVRAYGAHRSTRPPLATVLPPRTRDPRPSEFDFAALEPPVVDQNGWGHCCSSSVSAHTEMEWVRQGRTSFGHVSRRALQQFTNASEQHGSFDGKKHVEDSGCSITDMMYTAQMWGLIPESLWGYNNDLSHFPPPDVLKTGTAHVVEAWAWFRQDNGAYVIEDMLQCLAARMSFVFGFVVWDRLRLDSQYRLTPPPAKPTPAMPSHAVVAVGYSDARQALLCRHSGGLGYGLPGRLAGHFWFAYAWLRDPWVFDATRVTGFAEPVKVGV